MPKQPFGAKTKVQQLLWPNLPCPPSPGPTVTLFSFFSYRHQNATHDVQSPHETLRFGTKNDKKKPRGAERPTVLPRISPRFPCCQSNPNTRVTHGAHLSPSIPMARNALSCHLITSQDIYFVCNTIEYKNFYSLI